MNSPIFIILLIVLSIIIIIFLVSNYECNHYKIATFFISNNKNDGKIKLIYLSDFHNKNNTIYYNKLIDDIIKISPDLILLGGDIIQFSKLNSLFNNVSNENTMDFLNELSKKYLNNKINNDYNNKRIIYTLGNHELRLANKLNDKNLISIYSDYIKNIQKLGIEFLDNKTINITNKFTISGLSLYNGYYNKSLSKNKSYSNIAENILNEYFSNIGNETFNIICFHKPDYCEDLLNNKFDLVLSGHNHGGLIRLPYIGSLISPDLKLLPKYSYGLYNYNNKYAIVSSGLGEHFIKIRINNRPEICVIEIK